jgi:diguanylate cyclase (GGDEF)-like protein
MEDMVLGEMLHCRLVITEGEEGAILVDGNQMYRVLAPKIDGVRSLLGAGDAFMAGAVSFFGEERSVLHKALDRAAITAADVVVRDNCSLAEPRAIDRAIDFFHDEARKDGLTQIFNRASTMRFGEKMLRKTAKQNKPFAAIILDIDHFKIVNDTWGHPEGDKVIKNVATIVQQAMRESDICGRWGGEEFLCLLPGATEDIAMKVAERIRVTIEENLNEPKSITVSLGVAMGLPGVGLEDIISDADKALYISKNSGRNRVTLFSTP